MKFSDCCGMGKRVPTFLKIRRPNVVLMPVLSSNALDRNDTIASSAIESNSQDVFFGRRVGGEEHYFVQRRIILMDSVLVL